MDNLTTETLCSDSFSCDFKPTPPNSISVARNKSIQQEITDNILFVLFLHLSLSLSIPFHLFCFTSDSMNLWKSQSLNPLYGIRRHLRYVT